ncbi:hypothetical protein ABH978_002708 [Bradyrhizobium ottawaense]
MSITRSIRTPIMHRAVEANGFVFSRRHHRRRHLGLDG